jgi:general secretion pathway protein B
MSSIIDALKKSDQNRTNGNQSDVNDINFSDSNTPKSRRGFWLLTLVLLLVAAGVFAWQQGWHQKLLTAFENNDPINESVEKTSTTPTNQKPATKPVASQENKKAVINQATTNNQLVPPRQQEIKQKAELAKKQALNNTKITVTEKQKQAEVKPQTLEVVESKKEKINLLGTSDNKQQQSKPENPSNKPVTQTVKSSTEPTLQQKYLLLHQIDFAIRKNIPNIKINIHIYDPEPENRMVLINGERYNIGDQIESIVTIKDIVKEGIVVAYENLEFLIPK